MKKTICTQLPETFEFPSQTGTSLFLCPMKHVRIANVLAYVKTGSVHEGKDLGCGLSHFLEHMMFSGTAKYPGKTEISDRVTAAGGNLNACTSYDYTQYYMTVPADFAPEALSMLVDMMRNPLFPEDEFTRERDVILKESAMRTDNPDSLMWEEMMRKLYCDTQRRIPIIGLDAMLPGVTREKMLDYFKRRYTPDRIFFVIAGAFDEAKIKQTFQEGTDGWSVQSCMDEPVLFQQEKSGRTFSRLEFPDPTARISFGWNANNLTERERAALTTFSNILSSESNPLYTELKTERGIVSDVSAGLVPFPGQSYFCISAQTRPEHLSAVSEGIQKELNRRRSEPATEEELAEIRISNEMNLIQSLSKPRTLAAAIAGSIALSGNADFEARIKLIQNVTAEDIRQVIAKSLPEDSFTCVTMTPPEKAKRKTSRKKADKNIRPYLETRTDGPTLIHLEDHTLPLINMTLTLPGGSAFEREDECGIASLTAECMMSDNARYSEQELTCLLNENAIDFSVDTGRNSCMVSFNCMPSVFKQAVEATASVMEQPLFTDHTVERERENELDEFKSEILSRADSYAINVMLERLFGNSHPYGRSPEQVIQALTQANRKGVADYFQTRIRTLSGAAISFSGDLTQAQAQEAANRIFSAGKWQKKSPRRPAVPPMPADTSAYSCTLPLGQTITACGFRAPGVEAKARNEWSIAAASANSMSSHIFKTVRGTHGLAYYTYLMQVMGFGCGCGIFLAGTNQENAALAQNLLAEEIARLASTGLEQEEFDTARAMVRFSMNSSNVFDLGRRASLEQYLGNGAMSVWNDYDNIDAVTRDDVNRFLKALLKGIKPLSVTVFPS